MQWFYRQLSASNRRIGQAILGDDNYLDDDFQDDTLEVNGNLDDQNEKDSSFNESSWYL